MFISLPGDDLKTSLRLFVRSWILCIFCFHICVFVAIKIKFKPTLFALLRVGEIARTMHDSRNIILYQNVKYKLNFSMQQMKPLGHWKSTAYTKYIYKMSRIIVEQKSFNTLFAILHGFVRLAMISKEAKRWTSVLTILTLS